MKGNVNFQDICALIRQCGESGVSELKYGSLHVHFSPGTKRDQTEQGEDQTLSTTQPTGPDTPAHEDRDFVSEELRVREEQLAMTLLEDPVQFEKLLVAGELDEET